jgi:glucokinase
MLLAGDIGGTNTRLALFTDDAKEIVRDAVFPSAAHRSLASAIDELFDAGGSRRPKLRPKIKGATFGIAGPVLHGRVKATNLPWTVDERSLAKKLGLAKVTLINDLVALALGAIAAPKKDLHVLQGGRPRASGGTVVVLAAGTGLGEAALVWDGSRHIPCGTEGGHTDFAARSEDEWQLREFLARRIGGRVSYERILSGPGLGAVYDFFRDEKGGGETPAAEVVIREAMDRNAAIAELGASGKSQTCRRTLDLFASIYGAEAGNLALKYLAVGGVFVAGNIAAHLIPTLEKHFGPAFVDKGRFSPMMKAMPVAVVKSSSIGLHGSARHAAGLV